ncbi:pentapeptide repeat-containing protein [Anabaena sp. CCY 0017]|uniref:pentapeptide repeat-containing protein n=1 Tax=Anabaena sp. CCY 0017 TaxID=3103866 RepID=UPI0039C62094
MNAQDEKFTNLVKYLSTWRKPLIRIAVFVTLLGVIAIFAKLYPFEGVGEWTGIGQDSNKSVTTEKEINPKTQEVIKITNKETQNFQSAKTLWDWLSLGGVIAIPFALLYFERAEQRRSEKQADTEKKIANGNLCEQALEAYIDRMSELLIDKNLKVLIDKKLKETDPEYPLLDAALDIGRARTLSVLRRLDQDGERKGSVVKFLIDAELINNLDLSSADLSSANLKDANLSSANLKDANFSSADLSFTNLSSANLKDANFSSADLRGADLNSADLRSADLRSANLRGADLNSADLRYINPDSSSDKKLTPEQVRKAKNWEKAKYSEALRKELGLPPEPQTRQKSDFLHLG